jgi:Ca-activated chloride channel family protein
MIKVLQVICLILLSFQVLVCLAIAQSKKPNSEFSHILHISVFDEQNRAYINGLPKEAFTIFYAGEKQTVTFFGEQDVPASIGILVDASGSMKAHTKRLREIKAAVLNFIRQSNPKNNYFVMSFREKSQSLTDFTKNIATIGDALDQAIAAPQGESNLYDAFYDAIEKFQQDDNRNLKRVILLISDGLDKFSKHNFQELKKTLSQSDVMVYICAAHDSSAFQLELESEKLLELTSISGGRVSYLHPSIPTEQIVRLLLLDLQYQYTFGFTPTIKNGKYNKIQIALSPVQAKDISPKASGTKELKLKARTREGYLAK